MSDTGNRSSETEITRENEPLLFATLDELIRCYGTETIRIALSLIDKEDV